MNSKIEASSQPAIKWFHKPVFVVVAILAVGPFALPILWVSPAFRLWHKIALSLLILALTIWLAKGMADIYKVLSREMADLQNVMQK